MSVSKPAADDTWPSLALDAWRDTYATLHLWTQTVGKIRLALSHQSLLARQFVCDAKRTADRIDSLRSRAFQIDVRLCRAKGSALHRLVSDFIDSVGEK